MTPAPKEDEVTSQKSPFNLISSYKRPLSEDTLKYAGHHPMR